MTLATIDHVLKISSKSLIQDGQETAVFVIEKGRARKRTITLSARDADAETKAMRWLHSELQ